MGPVILWGKMEANRVTETSVNLPRNKVWTESWGSLGEGGPAEEERCS